MLQDDVSLSSTVALMARFFYCRHQCTTSRDTNEDMTAAFSSEVQRTFITFESYRNKNAREIHVALQEVCDNSALSYSQVAGWANHFNSKMGSIKDSEERCRKISASYAILFCR